MRADYVLQVLKAHNVEEKLGLFYLNAGGKMTVNGEELWRDRIKFRIKK